MVPPCIHIPPSLLGYTLSSTSLPHRNSLVVKYEDQ
jgi:hypothetical protein